MHYKVQDILTYHGSSVKSELWDKIESENNIHFPPDYKWFLEYYGVGSINDFLWILSPFCDNLNLNSLEQHKSMKKSYEFMKSSNYLIECNGYSFYADGKGLFPWGITDNGDELYWNYFGDSIELVVFASRYAGCATYRMTIDDFLYGVLTKKIDCSIFPDSFVLDKNYFTPLSR